MERDREGRAEGEGPASDPAPARTAVAGAALDPNPEDQRLSTLPVSAPPPGLIAGATPPDRMPLSPGAVVNHYEIVRELGRGGMGSVFLARDTRLARLCAIKVLLEYTGEGAGRFLAEARATARCKHENIVVIYEVHEIRGYPYMVLEHLEGRTLRAWMAGRERREPAPPSVALEIMMPVVRALVCAHEMGIVHRDLKPENIFLTESGQVKVLDFGIAKRIEAGEMAGAIASVRSPPAEDPGLTRQGALMGTLPYMSPEQWLGMDIDPQTDIWAAGVILHELVTGSHPLAPAGMAQLLGVRDLELPMPSVHGRRPDVGPLGAIIDRCLEKRKSERVGSARELLAELELLAPDREARAPVEDESPFAGLSAFQESDAPRFFGRERDIAAVLSRLRNQQLVVVAGPSGAGKSSFVRAGVIPALKRSEGGWEALILRPGRRPLAALADALALVSEAPAEAGAGAPEAADNDELAMALRARPGYPGARLRAHCRRAGGGRHILLFVDQFEELYTLGVGPDERAAFLACLEGVADDASSPLRVVLAVRSDFLDRMAADRHFMTEVARGLVFLPPMGREGLRDALTRPVEAIGYRFEGDELCEQMLDSLESTSSPLPLLQFTAVKLWEARDRGRRLVTRDGYRTLGGVAGALSAHADAGLAALPAPEQRLARSILLRLVTPERTRAVVSMAELRELSEGGDAAEQVVHHLAAARLLLIETGGDREGATVELVHESLIDRWAKLRQWLDENEKDALFLARARAAAQSWEASAQAEGLLWRDRAAEEARQWLERRRAERGADASSELGQREERYLSAVVALADRARRLRRGIVVEVIAALLVISVVVSYLAIRADEQATHAEEAAARAQAEARQARNATRMAAAREHEADPTAVLALLREVEPPDIPRGWSELARWALESGVARVALTHPDVVRHAAWSPDGRRIATASDRTVRVWGADGTSQPLELDGHEGAVISVAWSPDGRRIVTGSHDGTARVWSLDRRGEPLILRHQDSVCSAAWSPDGRRIVTASRDTTARVWSHDGVGEPVVLRGHEDALRSAAFSPDGKRIVTASEDRTARVWSAEDASELLVLRGHQSRVSSAAFSPDGKRIVTASWDKTARVWGADGSGEPLVLSGHQDGLYSAAFHPDGQRVVTASHDQTMRVWSAEDARERFVFRGHGDAVAWAAWSPDGRRIVSASMDKTVRVWDAEGPGRSRVLSGHQRMVYRAAWSPDGRRIVTASWDKTARVWDAEGRGRPVVLGGHEGEVNWAAFSPDGQRIVTASHDRTARVWSADGAGNPRVIRGHAGGLGSAAWSPDGQRVVTASDDRTVRVWDADNARELLVLQGHQGRVNTAVFSPDGRRIVTASQDKTARVWSADGAGEPLVLRGHEDPVTAAAWSPDGKRIVTASQDKTARVWSADGSGQPLVLAGHKHWVNSATFSPDGTRIVTASQDKAVRVWSADGTGEPLILRVSRFSYNSVAFSPDGKRIAAASDDHAAWVWSDFEPLSGLGDPKLWAATTYCMPIERRIVLLNVPEATAKAQNKACARHVEEARAASAEPL